MFVCRDCRAEQISRLTIMRLAGVEQGAITHVPSTKDLLAAVPVDLIVDRQAWRQRAHLVSDSLAVGLEHLADGRFEGPDTPRASFEGQGAITEFASGALDLEVRCALCHCCTDLCGACAQEAGRVKAQTAPHHSWDTQIWSQSLPAVCLAGRTLQG